MTTDTKPPTEAEQFPPVTVSGPALHTLGRKVREWSGWKNARLISGDPRTEGMPSPYAACDHPTRTFMFNPDRLILNPNKVLLTVTPFRLRQEGVLTGSLLHEAGHARHSHWQPGRYGNPMVLKHGSVHSFEDATPQCVKFARLMEEPRIEGLMARDADSVGAATLGWTMRAAAAHLLPPTAMSMDPNQKIMDLISSWALRAGRQYALEARISHRPRNWVADFTALLHTTILSHLNDRVEAGALDCNPLVDTRKIIDLLMQMTVCDDDTGSTMIDLSRRVLTLLFPETPGATDDDEAMPNNGCASEGGEGSEGDPSPSEQGEGGEGSESGEQGKGDTEPEDEGEGTDPGAGDSGEDEGEEQGSGDGGSPESDDEAEGEGESTPEDGEPGEGDEESDDATGSTGDDTDTDSPLAKALAEMERNVKSEGEDEADEEADKADDAVANGAGSGSGGAGGGGWRTPTKKEREVQKGANKFLRDLIDVSESSSISLTDTPSATVDGAALSSWKAGGQHKAPHFFVRTRRESEPSPPVKVAILVDVSMSMSELQKPSALLSWALSAAALDLRNFAGRGQQVESCLIHWGDDARVMQGVGEELPGLRTHRCDEGTSAMSEALKLVEAQMPGFFEVPVRPVNRLLVQFTDWQLFGASKVQDQIAQSMASGVNMLSVVPTSYNSRSSNLDEILRGCKVQRGTSSLLRYDKSKPEQVWEQASKALR